MSTPEAPPAPGPENTPEGSVSPNPPIEESVAPTGDRRLREALAIINGESGTSGVKRALALVLDFLAEADGVDEDSRRS